MTQNASDKKSLDKAFRDVIEFTIKVNDKEQLHWHIAKLPRTPAQHIMELRRKLLSEEYAEAQIALGKGDITELAKELCDVIYIALGTAITYGIYLPAVWDAVHASNLLKAGGPVREDGKKLKPEGWTKPNIHAILEEQGKEEILSIISSIVNQDKGVNIE